MFFIHVYCNHYVLFVCCDLCAVNDFVIQYSFPQKVSLFGGEYYLLFKHLSVSNFASSH